MTGHSAIYNDDDTMFVFGGAENPNKYSQYVYGYDIVKDNWRKISRVPSETRTYSSITKIGKNNYIFGG